MPHTSSDSSGVLAYVARLLLVPLRFLVQCLLLATVVACSAFVFGCVALTHWVDAGHRS